MMASQMSMPREGHLEVVFHVFSFICQKFNSRMAFYPVYPSINTSDFKDRKWKNFYG